VPWQEPALEEVQIGKGERQRTGTVRDKVRTTDVQVEEEAPTGIARARGRAAPTGAASLKKRKNTEWPQAAWRPRCS
jgi:hypothetical protein